MVPLPTSFQYVVDTCFIADVNAYLPETFDGNFFMILVVAIDGQQEISNKSGQHLHHETIFAP